jgi:RNA-directed DNA polymerase
VRGWCGYFRPGVSYATFAYLGHYLWFWRASHIPDTGPNKVRLRNGG